MSLPLDPAAGPAPRSAAGHAARIAGARIAGPISAMALGIAALWTSVHAFGEYGAALFVAMPTAAGFVSAVVTGRLRGDVRLRGALWSAFWGIVSLGVGMFALTLEGAVCLAMCLPLATPMALLGGWIAWRVLLRAERLVAPGGVFSAAVLLPLVIWAEAASSRTPPVWSVTTSIEVAAPPEVVWRRVVAFPEIAGEPGLPFRMGLAYPLRARIVGEGVGAIRYCEFTTGAFVEPITVWEPPARLEFDVASQPDPMTEWSWRGDLDVPHLHGFLVSHHGRFLLEPLDGGQRTRLAGTTWYSQRYYPLAYWRLYSDAIIHRIHARVLEHIARLAEGHLAGTAARSF